MDISENVRIRVHVIPELALGRERRRFLSKDARKASLYLRKGELVSSFKFTGNIIPDTPRSYLGRRRLLVAKGLEAPLPLHRHLCPANLPGLEDHVIFAQTESSDPCRVPPAIHLANLMCASLQGQNPARDERAHNVVRADVGFIIKLLDIPDDPVGLNVALPRIEFPIGLRRGAGNICRQVDKIGSARVPNIEESLLPSSA
jgi:hypothetical protein